MYMICYLYIYILSIYLSIYLFIYLSIYIHYIRNTFTIAGWVKNMLWVFAALEMWDILVHCCMYVHGPTNFEVWINFRYIFVLYLKNIIYYPYFCWLLRASGEIVWLTTCVYFITCKCPTEFKHHIKLF